MTTARPSLEVLATGPLALIQDLGRPGLASVGVGRSGAADRASFRLGARLLAQDDTAAAIEVTFGGLEVRAHGTVMLALTGAPAPALVGRTRVAHLSPFVLHSGDVLRLGVPTAGLRSYLSVRGGVDVPAVLGSRSTDVLSGLGPAPLRAGDVLAVGPSPARFPHVDVAPLRPLTNDPIAVRAASGPRADWLAEPDAAGDDDLDRLQPQRPGRHPAGGHGPAPPPLPAGPGAAERGRGARGASRCRPAASRCSSSPTTRSPAATRWRRSSGTPTWTGWPRRCRDSPSASRSPPRPDRAAGHGPA